MFFDEVEDPWEVVCEPVVEAKEWPRVDMGEALLEDGVVFGFDEVVLELLPVEEDPLPCWTVVGCVFTCAA